jgi:hypothetical protein
MLPEEMIALHVGSHLVIKSSPTHSLGRLGSVISIFVVEGVVFTHTP